jgi:hypothetical protein
MADIFISYSKADHALALKLSAFLEAEGWTVWWRFLKQVRQKPLCCIRKGVVIKATANHVACHCGGISLIPWRLDAPTSLVVATAAKIIHHMLPHIAQIASIARIEFVDFAEIDVISPR